MKKSKQQLITHICIRKNEKNSFFIFTFFSLRLPDVGEEAIIEHDGKEVSINVNMLNDVRKLGFGNYGSVMLAEVENHPEIKMAVKVDFNLNY